VFAACALAIAGCSSTSATPSSTESPLTKLFGTADELRTRQRTVEQSVAKCMTAKGWTYTPVDADAVFGALTSPDPLTDAKFRDSYGYGIVNKAPAESSGGNGNIATDPNAEYIATLSDEKPLQYGVDLDGPNARVAELRQTAPSPARLSSMTRSTSRHSKTSRFGPTTTRVPRPQSKSGRRA
jgi:hypothetical protein